jgi:hypothetical protein
MSPSMWDLPRPACKHVAYLHISADLTMPVAMVDLSAPDTGNEVVTPEKVLRHTVSEVGMRETAQGSSIHAGPSDRKYSAHSSNSCLTVHTMHRRPSKGPARL